MLHACCMDGASAALPTPVPRGRNFWNHIHVRATPATPRGAIFPPPAPRGAGTPSTEPCRSARACRMLEPPVEGMPTRAWRRHMTGAADAEVTAAQALLVFGTGAGKRRGTARRHFGP